MDKDGESEIPSTPRFVRESEFAHGHEFALELRGVWKSYGDTQALRDVWLGVRRGLVLAVLGPNGAGKSTLLRIAAGIARPNRGDVCIDGRSLATDPSVRRRVGFAGHLSFLYGHLTAEENLRFYAQLYGSDPERTLDQLDRFGLMPYRRRPVRTLSRGLVQRVSLARALLHDPQVVLLDEPFTGLDLDAARMFRETIADLRAGGRGVVMATHAWADAQELADEAVVLVSGRLALQETASALDRDRLAALYQTV